MINIGASSDQQFHCFRVAMVRCVEQWSPTLRIHAVEIGAGEYGASKDDQIASLCS